MSYFLINKYRLLKLLSDLFLFTFSYITAFLLRFDFPIPPDATEIMFITLPVVVFIRLGVFWKFGLFRGEWRYSSLDDLFSLFKAVSLSSIAIIGMVYLLSQFQGYPRSVFIIDWLLVILLTGSVRFVRRIVREVLPQHTNNGKRALIVGSQEIATSIIREARANYGKGYSIVGLIDDNPEKHGARIHGIEVVGGRRIIPHIVATKKINEVIIAEPNASAKDLWEIIEYCQLADVEFKIIPASQGADYRRNYLDLAREIRLEDLIGRKPVTCDLQQIQKHIQGTRVLITGAGGSIGSELSRQVAGFNPEELILLDRAENSIFYIGLELSRTFPSLTFRQVVADLMNRPLIEKILCQYQPNLIFHAAAHKHVPLMELNPAEAIKNNVLGTRNIARAAMKNGVAEFVFISTDKAVKPISFMGVSKRIGEQYTQALAGLNHTKFLSVRFGNVLGSSGSVVRLFKEQLERERTLSVTHPEATRYFMSISEAVLLILQATLFGKGGEIFILDMGEPVNIYKIAKAMVSLSKEKVRDEYKILFTGLRPGDKLHEELYDDEEQCLPTPHKKILAINGGGKLNLTQLDHDLDELEKQVDEMDRYALAAKLRAIVPSFKPMPHSTQNHRSDGVPNVQLPQG